MTAHFAVDQDGLDELAEMSRAVWRVIKAEPDAQRAKVLAEIFDIFGEVLSAIDSAPITIAPHAEPRV